MTTSAELATAINEQTALIEKIGTETTATLAKVAELQAAIDAGAVTPEVQAAFDALKVQVGKVDDLVKDSPSPAV